MCCDAVNSVSWLTQFLCIKPLKCRLFNTLLPTLDIFLNSPETQSFLNRLTVHVIALNCLVRPKYLRIYTKFAITWTLSFVLSVISQPPNLVTVFQKAFYLYFTDLWLRFSLNSSYFLPCHYVLSAPFHCLSGPQRSERTLPLPIWATLLIFLPAKTSSFLPQFKIFLHN
jgi:hypothetical protein